MRFELILDEEGDGDQGYLQFMKSKPGIVDKNIRLSDLIGMYKGPDIYIDLTKDGELFGIDVLEGPDQDKFR